MYLRLSIEDKRAVEDGGFTQDEILSGHTFMPSGRTRVTASETKESRF